MEDSGRSERSEDTQTISIVQGKTITLLVVRGYRAILKGFNLKSITRRVYLLNESMPFGLRSNRACLRMKGPYWKP